MSVPFKASIKKLGMAAFSTSSCNLVPSCCSTIGKGAVPFLNPESSTSAAIFAKVASQVACKSVQGAVIVTSTIDLGCLTIFLAIMMDGNVPETGLKINCNL